MNRRTFTQHASLLAASLVLSPTAFATAAPPFPLPIAITTRTLTSQDDAEMRACVQSLKATHASTGYMHESFHKDDPKNFTRAWFAWANTIFGEFLWKVYQEKPTLLA